MTTRSVVGIIFRYELEDHETSAPVLGARRFERFLMRCPESRILVARDRGASYGDIARKLGVTISKVKTLERRARNANRCREMEVETLRQPTPGEIDRANGLVAYLSLFEGLAKPKELAA